VLLLDGRTKGKFACSCLLQLDSGNDSPRSFCLYFRGLLISFGFMAHDCFRFAFEDSGFTTGMEGRRTEEKAGRRFILFWGQLFWEKYEKTVA
jgi:hypothetical protein